MPRLNFKKTQVNTVFENEKAHLGTAIERLKLLLQPKRHLSRRNETASRDRSTEFMLHDLHTTGALGAPYLKQT